MLGKFVITTGDVNGIGAEITVKALKILGCRDFVLVSNRKILDFYGGSDLECDIVEIPYDAEITPGRVTKESGEFSYRAVKKACELRPKAIITAPISKEALHLAGYKFDGHTELLEYFLAHEINGKMQKSEMLFVAGDFRVFLLTRHCALKSITLSKDLIIDKIERLVGALTISSPKIALCGLNPHAGENGILGREEQEIIIPAVEELRRRGINVSMPLPSDTLFLPVAKAYKNAEKPTYDCYVAMYHDQGLIPMKVIAGENCVNVTIGLDILRTSPCHGTAFDIAGKNIANVNPMLEAIKCAQMGEIC